MSSAYQYKRLGWRSKYDTVQHKSYDNIHTKSYETLSTKNYDMAPSRSYDTLPTKSYSMRRKSYDTRYDTDDESSYSMSRQRYELAQNNPYELVRRRSFDNDLRYDPERRKSFTQPSKMYDSMSSRIYERMPQKHYETMQSKSKSYEALESKRYGIAQSISVETGLHKGHENVHSKNNDPVEVKSNVVEQNENNVIVQNQSNETVQNKISETVPQKSINTIQRKIKSYENMQNVVDDTTRRRSFDVDRRYDPERRKSYSVQSKSYDTEQKKSYEAVQNDFCDTEKEKVCDTEQVKSIDATKSKINDNVETAACNGILLNKRSTSDRQSNRRSTNNDRNKFVDTERKINNIRRSKSSDTVRFKNSDAERRKSADSGYLKSFDVELQPASTDNESFKRSNSGLYKTSVTELCKSSNTERCKTDDTDSHKISDAGRYDIKQTKDPDAEKCSKADAEQYKSSDPMPDEIPEATHCISKNTEQHKSENIPEFKVNGTMQNERDDSLGSDTNGSDRRKSYDKMDIKVNGNAENKIWNNMPSKEYEVGKRDPSLNGKDHDPLQTNIDIPVESKTYNGVQNGVHNNVPNNGHDTVEREINGTLQNGTKDIKSFNNIENKTYDLLQDKITETMKNKNNDTMERKTSHVNQNKNYDSVQNNNYEAALHGKGYDGMQGKVYNKGQTKSYATAYRNQINRKRDRLLYAEKISDFEHNGLCLWLALQKIHQGFRKIFHTHFSRDPHSLYKELSVHRVKLYQLQQRGLIEQVDWDVLFPLDSNTDSRMFDLILLSLLIRTVCEYREPKEGWWKVSTAKDGIDTIHFSKIFSICTELSSCNFSINDGMFEFLRKRLERYMTMLYPPNEEVLNVDYIDNNFNDEFVQFSTAKEKSKVLEKKINRIERLLKAIWWDVPSYTSTYIHRKTGMDDVLEKRLKLTEIKQDINATSIFALTGPAGIGKTEIARFWAYHYCQQVDGNVIWIDSDNPNNIDTTFVKLAKRLGISLQDKFGKPVIVDGLHHHIYEQFSHRKSLFIFDNVKDDPTLQKIIPYSKQLYPIILITMQGQTSRRGIISYELKAFSNEKALKLVEQIADHCDIRDTQKLAEKMNHLPFSLELASHIISKRGITIIEFLKQFEKMKNEDYEYDYDGSKLIRILVQMCIDGFEYDKNRTCVEDLLCVMSLMDGNRIDMELLLHMEEHSKVDIKAALKEIHAYSLIKMRNYRNMNSKKCSFKMHPTIQYALQKSKLEEFAGKNTFHLNGFFEMYHLRKVLDIVDRFREHENKLNPSYGELWAHHIICIIYTYRSSKAVMSKLEVFKHDIAIFNIQNRHYQSALYILEIFRNFEVSLMVDNEDLLLDTEREYGNCFLMQGNFDAALSVFLKIHAKERDIFENVQEPTLLTRFHIGICLQYLAISERHYTNGTENASDILKPRGTGAMFKREDEKISAALSVFQDVYTKANETLSGRHPLVVTAFHHIGICKYYQGDLSTALKIFLKVSEIVLDLDCEKQPNNLLMEDQLSRIDEGSVSKVPSDLAAFEELYARQKDLLGETHPIALESKSQIAKCLQNVGNFLPALKHFSEIYEELKNLYGEEHPRSLTCREDIGNCLRKTKEFSAAFEIFKDVSKKRYCLLGENHPHTLDSQYETGLCLYYLNEFQAATSILHHVFERKKKILGELHASTLLTKQTYGICIRDSGDTSLASKVLQEVYEKYKIVYGENHPTTLGSKQQIGICYLRQLRFSTAYDILKEVSEKFHALFGEENLRTLTSEYHVSLCLMKLGKFMDALILLRNICDNLDKLIGLEEPIYLNSAHHLGICLQAQGYLWTAINVFQEVYNLRKNNKGSPSTLCSGHRLGMCCLDIGNHYAARYAFNELYHTLSNR